MPFTDQQIQSLSAKLDASHVKTRDQAGQKLSYIEGWHAIAEANRIFGYDAWDRETVWINCVWSGDRETKYGPKPAASYVARVRITVRSGDGVVVREGTGAGSGFGKDHGEAHESAIKEAETDAMKRALMTFGNPFGLALCDKAQENVERGEQKQQRQQRAPADDVPLDKIAEPRELWKRLAALIDDAPTLNELNGRMRTWGDDPDSADPQPGSLLAKLPAEGMQALRDRANKRRGVLAQAPGKKAA